ncbi:ATP synthase F1 subunit gamma [soil metagenome]
MKKYLEFKEKVSSYEDIGMTVKTIEQVAASQIHTFKDTLNNLNQYISAITTTLQRLTYYYKPYNHALLQQKTSGKKVLFLITSDKGLVGGLFHLVISHVMAIKSEYSTIYAIGQRGKRYLHEEDIKIIDQIFELSAIPSSEEIEVITNFIFSLYMNHGIMAVDIVYPSFVSISEQAPTVTPFLPFVFTQPQTRESESVALGFPLFESAKKDIYTFLLERYIHSIFYKIVVEAKLSEFAARTIAMEHASAKIKKFSSQISQEYFKERRTSVTQKQLESFTAHKQL